MKNEAEDRIVCPDYKNMIIEMIQKIENPLILKLIYGFAKSGYEEEKAGRT